MYCTFVSQVTTREQITSLARPMKTNTPCLRHSMCRSLRLLRGVAGEAGVLQSWFEHLLDLRDSFPDVSEHLLLQGSLLLHGSLGLGFPMGPLPHHVWVAGGRNTTDSRLYLISKKILFWWIATSTTSNFMMKNEICSLYLLLFQWKSEQTKLLHPAVHSIHDN